MYNHLAPEYLSSFIPQQVNDTSHYNLRNSHNIQTIRAKISQYNNSFLPSILRDWNNLPIEAKQANALGSFKYFLKKDKKNVPKYYYYWNRKAQILHTRLRTGCSSLNLDLFLKTFTDTPLCNCGTIENAQHCLFPLQILSMTTYLTSKWDKTIPNTYLWYIITWWSISITGDKP